MLPSLIANNKTALCVSSFSNFLFFFLSLGLADLNIASYANSDSPNIQSPQYLPLEAQWCLKSGSCLLLEIANTDEEKRIGLMQRSSLPIGTGMWFRFFPRQPVRFWMYKTLIPLDMIFISKGIIVSIETNLKVCHSSPCAKYGPNQLVDGVIEIGAGEVDRLAISVGDIVSIEPIIIPLRVK